MVLRVDFVDDGFDGSITFNENAWKVIVSGSELRGSHDWSKQCGRVRLLQQYCAGDARWTCATAKAEAYLSVPSASWKIMFRKDVNVASKRLQLNDNARR